MPGIITVRQAARTLKEHPADVRGAIKGLGIQVTVIGRAHVISETDYERLAKAFAQAKPPVEFDSAIAN